jgi:cyclopropane fatty-acyl-phospholipid synthase-like methyltransferase
METRRVDKTLSWVTGPMVLDVGCTSHEIELNSEYWLHGRLRKKFPGVVGIDVSRDNVQKLQALGYNNLHIQSAEDFELNSRFDSIVAGELIEHLSCPGDFLIRAKQHLAPGGRIILTTPYPFSILYSLYAILKYPKTCQNPQHTCWFCPRTMEELANRCGLKVRHWELVEDYRYDDSSRAYRCLAWTIRICATLPVSKRFTGNTILFVLESRECGGES